MPREYLDVVEEVASVLIGLALQSLQLQHTRTRFLQLRPQGQASSHLLINNSGLLLGDLQLPAIWKELNGQETCMPTG